MTSPAPRTVRRPNRPHARGAALAAVLGLVAVAAGAVPVRAQEVRGTAVESGSGSPVSGAFVSLVPEGSERALASTLTGRDGAYILHAFRAGRYSLRVERIGYATWRSEPFEAGPGRTVTRRLSVAVRPVSVAGLRVEVDSRCASLGPDAGARLTGVWEEVRKALAVTRWTEEQASVRLELARWARTLEPESGRIRDEETRTGSKRSWRSFVSAPAEELAAEGWIRRDGDAWHYFAPDADVLLSDAFAARHCFSLVSGSPSGEDAATWGGDGEAAAPADWIGIRFEPAGRPPRPDVQGVLWLDEESAELRRLEFSYTGPDLPLPDHPGGGRVEFARLPTGHWFVRRWRLRMPVVGTRSGLRMRGANAGPLFRGVEETSLAAVREVGGEVERARFGSGEMMELAERGSLFGFVREAHGDPVASAEVRLAGTPHRVRTGPEGRFRFDLVAPGTYTAEAVHPEAAVWRLPAARAPVHVEVGETVEVGLDLPSVEEALAAACGDGDPGAEAAAEGAMLAGVVRAARTGEPIGGAKVWIVRTDYWFRDRPWSAQVREEWTRLVVETDAAGAYLACGLGEDEFLVVQAKTGRVASDIAWIRTSSGGVHRLDLEVSPERWPVAGVGIEGRPAAGDPAALANPPGDRARRGAATLTGTVRSTVDGQAVSGARVRLLGGAHEVVTGPEGRFVIPDLEPGSYRLVTEYVGAASDTVPVHLEGGTVQVVRLGLETRPVLLPELRVAVERTVRNPRLAGFYERMARGLGDFIAYEDLEGVDVIGALRRIPFVQVQQCITGSGLRQASCWDLRIARGTGLSTHCPPRIFRDGHLLVDEPLTRLQQLPRDMIEGIEVHRGPGTVPAGYGGADSACGVVLVWTRGRRAP